jgi:hypothetical protein
MANKKDRKKFTPTANPALAQGMREIAFSNKAGTHDNRPNRQRTRSTQKTAAINKNGW